MVITNSSIYKPRMRPNPSNRLDKRRILVLSLGLLSAYMTWAFFNAKVPVLLAQLIESKTIIGLIMALDNFLAIILQPLFGFWSDRTKSRFGRRLPFIMIGSILSITFLALLPIAFLVLGSFILTIALFDISMNIWRSPALVLLADYVPDKFQVQGNALGQFIGSLGPLLGLGITPLVNTIFPTGDLNRGMGFFIVSIVMVILLTTQIKGIKETPTGSGFLKTGKDIFEMDKIDFNIKPLPKSPELEPLKLKLRLRNNLVSLFNNKDKSAYFLFLATFCWYFAFSAIETFGTQFGTEYLFLTLINEGKITYKQAESLTNLILLAFSASTVFSALAGGVLCQKFGRKKVLVICLEALIIFMIVFSVIVVPLQNIPLFAIGMIGVGFFWINLIVTSIPMIWTLAPPAKLGTFTGIYYTFTQIAGIGSPFLLGVILDLGSLSLGPNKYLLLFPYLLVFLVLAFLCITRVQSGEVGSSLKHA